MSETTTGQARFDERQYDAVLDEIVVTEGVFELPAAVRLLSPDELEAAGLPREFLRLSPAQKAAAVRSARGEDVPPAELGRVLPDSTEQILDDGDGDGDGDGASEPGVDGGFTDPDSGFAPHVESEEERAERERLEREEAAAQAAALTEAAIAPHVAAATEKPQDPALMSGGDPAPPSAPEASAAEAAADEAAADEFEQPQPELTPEEQESTQERPSVG